LPDRRALLKLGVLLALLAAIVTLAVASGAFERFDPATVAERIRDLRDVPAAPVIFVAAYALLVMLALPGSSLTLAGGAVFGFATGSLLNWLGATIGAAGAYAIGRGLGRDAVRSLLGRRASAFDRLVADHGFLAMLRLRLIPLVPFNALNFSAGLAGVSARDYLIATAVGIIPGTLVYTYFADALLSGATEAHRDAQLRLGIAAALLIALSFAPALVRRRQKAR
jgi:uncharacterized membrane protein YdjX (TVP38/TMEM64 family)